jgi:hypothetical protein
VLDPATLYIAPQITKEIAVNYLVELALYHSYTLTILSCTEILNSAEHSIGNERRFETILRPLLSGYQGTAFSRQGGAGSLSLASLCDRPHIHRRSVVGLWAFSPIEHIRREINPSPKQSCLKYVSPKAIEDGNECPPEVLTQLDHNPPPRLRQHARPLRRARIRSMCRPC